MHRLISKYCRIRRNFHFLGIFESRYNSTFIEKTHLLQVYSEIITKDEEEAIVKYLTPILARRHYEGSHWDSVISKYKEIELLKTYRIPPAVQAVFDRLMKHVRQECNLPVDSPFLAPHVIDLAEDGFIGHHVDSIKFSGDFICGLSLISEREMSLKKEAEVAKTPDSEEYPPEKIFHVPPRSLYIMKGIWRYEYAHAISLPLPVDKRIIKEDNPRFPEKHRRISLIFRNPLPPVNTPPHAHPH